MKRSDSSKWKTHYDVIVVGGGIYGAWSAWHAARRGYTVLIVDKGDWAAGTSSISTKLIHGGLRYLERFEISLVRKALLERKVLHELLPNLVWPLRFMVPLYRGGRVGRFSLSLGLWLYDFLAGAQKAAPRRARHSLQETRKLCPKIKTSGLVGALSYGDCQTDDARLTLEVIKSAVRSGGDAANHARVESIDSNAREVVIEDPLTGESKRLSAGAIIVAAGPWIPQLLPDELPKSSVVMNKGVHLVMEDIGLKDAILNFSKEDGRVYFIVPWYGRTLVGTTDTYYASEVDEIRADPEDIDYLLASANAILPGLEWKREDVIQTFAGVRFLQAADESNPSAVSREWDIVEPAEAILVSVGGKLTSARVDASEMIDRVDELLSNGRQPVAADSNETFYPGIDDWQAFFEENAPLLAAWSVDQESAQWLLRRHPAELQSLLEILEARPALAQRIVPELPFIQAELILAVRHEMVGSLDDLLQRRIPVGLLASLSPEQLEGITALVRDELGGDLPR